MQFFRAENGQNAKIAAIVHYFFHLRLNQQKSYKISCIFAGFGSNVVNSGQKSCTFAVFGKAS
jgi:hypothetical protein